MSYEQLAMREYARNVGREYPERAWICTPLDSWEPNPFYAGPPARHPEDDCDEAGESVPPACQIDDQMPF